MAVTRSTDILTGYWFDILLRIVLVGLFIELEKAEPFTRKIHEDELWLYKNPKTDSYVPTTLLWPLVFIIPSMVILFTFLIYKDRTDTYQAILCVTLALGFNGVITDIIKLIVGRPRPDFFWRCFPDGQANSDFKCSGNPVAIRDGKKSFPSGHSSFAFASFGFIALYIAGKLHTFSLRGKGQSWKLCAFILPICIALVIALSRTCDYHHHWQDVVAGSIIGYFLTYICYRHYYPPLDSQVCHVPYSALTLQIQLENTKTRNEQVKWI
ncbi:phospholipid phosphatase 5 isoform X1 [Megachile rotundata]|uniref:phospholipid phosphatase 5 isoform X1 n=1 Tax=Megachile rotundata TaxID=143995 RepID=UPI000258F6BB|nr:PREDICTED: phosphatidate phosphatase PPAPDC1B isoform X1 [Megachile rotundata]XP_012153360.1 PREDICTED: phosphatidate phosphatase PPAPDC1B isoform X1 [Megachile rotundata]XP_012153361.1 PREDICTED: phosphatidate phosphatase PPAPDC1B isoform X1 [Megachile rotundata]